MWFQKLNEYSLPSLENEMLWSYLLNIPREKLYLTDNNYQPSTAMLQSYYKLAKKRSIGYPFAYLTGKKSFWQNNFVVTPDVLIPRPETELLVEKILEDNFTTPSLKILELGTGSGIIAISLAHNHPDWQITAIDLSYNALQIAITNATYLHLNNIFWLQSNWFEKLKKSTFDIIVANPPYIEPNDPYLKGEIRFEPQTALISPNKGLNSLLKIIKNAPFFINKTGKIYLEHGYNQSIAVKNMLKNYKYQKITTFKDLNQHPRITTAYYFK